MVFKASWLWLLCILYSSQIYTMQGDESPQKCELNRRLLEAATRGSVQDVLAALEAGADKYAIERDYVREEEVRSALNLACNLRILPHYYETIVHRAARLGHISLLKSLLERGMDPNIFYPCTPLFVAFCSKQQEAARLLIQHKSRLDLRIHFNSLLHEAIWLGWGSVVEALLELGVDPGALEDIYRYKKISALSFAERKNHEEKYIKKYIAQDPEAKKIVNLLVTYGAVSYDKNGKNKQDIQLVDTLFKHNLFIKAVLQDDTEKLFVLLLMFYITRGEHQRALRLAERAQLYCSCRIIRTIFNIEKTGEFLVVRAQKLNNTLAHVLSYLFQVASRTRDRNLEQEQRWLAQESYIGILPEQYQAVLLGRNLEEIYQELSLAFNAALLGKKRRCAFLFLRELSPDISVTQALACLVARLRQDFLNTERNTNIELKIIELFMHAPAEIIARFASVIEALVPTEQKLLYYAVRFGRTSFVRRLLEKGNVQAHKRFSQHETLLHKAARHDNRTLSQLLITYGADEDAINIEGISPLYRACTYGNIPVARLLLSYGAQLPMLSSEVVVVDDAISRLLCLYGALFTDEEIERLFENILIRAALMNNKEEFIAFRVLEFIIKGEYKNACELVIKNSPYALKEQAERLETSLAYYYKIFKQVFLQPTHYQDDCLELIKELNSIFCGATINNSKLEQLCKQLDNYSTAVDYALYNQVLGIAQSRIYLSYGAALSYAVGAASLESVEFLLSCLKGPVNHSLETITAILRRIENLSLDYMSHRAKILYNRYRLVQSSILDYQALFYKRLFKSTHTPQDAENLEDRSAVLPELPQEIWRYVVIMLFAIKLLES